MAAGFGEGDAFAVMKDASGVHVSILGANALRVEVPPEAEVGPAVVGCAWTRGVFVDLDVSVAVRFERAPEGIAAGMWLRSSKTSAICVLLTPDGALSVTVRRDETLAQLGGVPAAGAVSVLRARVARDVLTLYRNGTAAMSVTCPTDIAGGADLVVEVPKHERGSVVFEDVCARLP